MKKVLLGIILVLFAAPVGADLVANRVSVATSATIVCTAFQRGGYCKIRNAGANSIFLGDATVTTANGYELTVGSIVDLPMAKSERVYGIVAAATERADVIRYPWPPR